ncbi:MAG: hypothetical protein DMF83_21275 [Acidobacteria bacterium]|nr:MAG: hypothetical protein DMF83_21275 [Acidobacteriota bacterium]
MIMSAADWELLGRNASPWPKPRRDLIATDGQRLTLGDTTLTLYLTAGHTPGTTVPDECARAGLLRLE